MNINIGLHVHVCICVCCFDDDEHFVKDVADCHNMNCMKSFTDCRQIL